MKGLPSYVLFVWILLATSYLASCQASSNNSSNINQTIKCQKTQYTSLFTRCDINFDYCNATSFTFINCYKRQCERYVRGTECRLWTKIQLAQSQCYKQCCGTIDFHETTCNSFNSQKEETQAQITGVIIAIICVSAVILIAVAAYLLIRVQKCLKKGENRKISKYNIFWRNQRVRDSVCEICKNYGAAIITPCNHYFHASCFEQKATQKDLPLCPQCNIAIKERLRISCSGCKEKVFKIKLWRISHLEEILKEAGAMHNEVCSQSARSDQHLLLSPNIL